VLVKARKQVSYQVLDKRCDSQRWNSEFSWQRVPDNCAGDGIEVSGAEYRSCSLYDKLPGISRPRCCLLATWDQHAVIDSW